MNKEDKLSFDFPKYSVACVLTHRYPHNKQTNKLVNQTKLLAVGIMNTQ